MRAFSKHSLSLLSLLAMLSVAGVVFLYGLGIFHLSSHRKAEAPDLMAQARERIVREGSLFVSLIYAADDQATSRLRQQLVENERAFHTTASEYAFAMPEAKAEIEALVSRFDHLAAAGWQASAVAPQSSPEAKAELLEGNFSRALDELRSDSERMELALRKRSANGHPR